MTRIRTLVVVLAGGAGGRLELLTHERAKPAVPFAGTHRLIDFALSNCHNAGLSDVWVAQQFNPLSLSDHLANGRPWDLDRTTGGLVILQPRQGNDERGGFTTGTADALWRFAPMIRDFDPAALVVVSADAVYAQDYGALVEEHMATDAAVTLCTTEVEPDDAGRYGVVQLDGERVREYVYKPEQPASATICTEVFVFSPGVVLDLLDELGSEPDVDLGDLGDHLLPRLVEAGAARAHRFDGFWRDVGTVEAYWSTHQELLSDPPPFRLDDPDWPMLTAGSAPDAPARVLASATVDTTLLGAGVVTAGDVKRSVVGRSCVIEAGAVVTESVLLPGVTVRAGARVGRAILDSGVEVGPGATVGDARAGREITLVGMRATVDADARVPAGARHPEPDD